MCLTKETLVKFLDDHKKEPLPDWFPVGKYKDYDSNKVDTISTIQDRLALVTPKPSDKCIAKGLTVLPYIPGRLSYVKATDIVISYPFTGCYMAVFSFISDHTSTKYVAHIAIGDLGSKEKKDDKFLYHYLTTSEEFNVIGAFNPFGVFNPKDYDFTGYKKIECYAIITSENTPYAFLIGESSTGWKVIDWKKKSLKEKLEDEDDLY